MANTQAQQVRPDVEPLPNGGVRINVSDDFIRRNAEVFGECHKCGKPAQISEMYEGRFVKGNLIGAKFRNVCVDCGAK